MALGVLFSIIAILGSAFCMVVLRAAPRRWDNRLFAALGFLDAISNASRAITIFGDHALTDPVPLKLCAGLSYVMSWASIEFVYSFPFNRPAPMRLRIPIVIVTLLAWFLPILLPNQAPSMGWELARTLFYFLPAFVVMGVLIARNLRNATSAAQRLPVIHVGSFLMLRWASGLATYGVGLVFFKPQFPTFVFVDSTIVLLVCYLLITFALMRTNLFSIRGLAVDMLVLATSIFTAIALAFVAIECALRTAAGPWALRAELVLASLIPLGAAVVGAKLRGRFERAIKQNIDPRRALREQVLEHTQEVRDPDPATLVRLCEDAMSKLSGGKATFLANEQDEDLPYDLVTPVRSARTTHGMLVVKGEVDHDTTVAATALADRLALKLDAYALFVELEASRRLATLGSFAAAIAHDIRTPLTSIQMNVQILKKKVSLAPDDMEYFDIALEELKRLNTSIQELLDFAKPAQITIAATDLADVVADVKRTTASVLREKDQSLHVTHEGDTPIVLGDPQRLRNVLENLVTNAANASAECAQIDIRTRRAEDGRAAIEVTDRGHGIAAPDLARIFEPFFTTRADGTGLGLAICDKLVRAQNGEIRVESSPGDGATFRIYLPAQQNVTEGNESLHSGVAQVQQS